MVRLPKRIGVNAEVDVPLPLGTRQLASMHLDCGAVPGDHRVRVRTQVVIPARIGCPAKVGGDHHQMITVRQRQYGQGARLAGTRSSGRQHDDRKAGNQGRQGGTAPAEPEDLAIDADHHTRAYP